MTKRRKITSGVLFILGACAMSAAAQDPLQDSVAVTQAARRLGQLLQEYVVAQERYFVNHAAYADSVARLELGIPVGAHVEVVQASATGHSAVATLERFPRIRCGIWVGNAAAPLETHSDEGRPACIVDERAPSRRVASGTSSPERQSAAVLSAIAPAQDTVVVRADNEPVWGTEVELVEDLRIRRPRIEWIEPNTFDVIGPDGTYFGEVTVPQRTAVQVRRGMRVWAVQRGKFDEHYVVRFKIVSAGR